MSKPISQLPSTNSVNTGDLVVIVQGGVTKQTQACNLTNASIPDVGNINSTISIVQSHSGNWDSAYSSLTSTSGNWNTAYTGVSLSANCWNYAYNCVALSASRWNATTNCVNVNSPNWNTAYNCVINCDPSWTCAANFVANGGNVQGNICAFGDSWVDASDLRINGVSIEYIYGPTADYGLNAYTEGGFLLSGCNAMTLKATNSSISLGTYVSACGEHSFGQGYYNAVLADNSSILGGSCNTISLNSPRSTIVGGSGNCINGFANAFIIGSNITASEADYTYVNNLSVQGIFASSGSIINGNLIVNGSLSALSGAYFTNTYFSTTSAISVVNIGYGPALYIQQVGPGDIVSFYDADGNNEVLHVGNECKVGVNESFPNKELTVNGELSATGIIYTTDGCSTNWNNTYTTVSNCSADWGGGLTILQEVSSTTAPNLPRIVLGLAVNQPFTTDIDVALIAKGTGATLAQIPDNTIVGGNKRGEYATDWQKCRGNSAEVASGCWSTVGGGICNTASAEFAPTVGGGTRNTASGDYSTVGGGNGNVASCDVAVVGGGGYNIANNLYATVGGGQFNTACGTNSTVGGGECNIAFGNYSTIGGGNFNKACAPLSFIAGGCCNKTQLANTFLLGSSLTASAINYTYVNNISSQGLVVATGGCSTNWNSAYTTVNTNSASWGTGGGGGGGSSTIYSYKEGSFSPNTSATNVVANSGITIGAYLTACGNFAITMGYASSATGNYSKVGGGLNNQAIADFTTVAGGACNFATALSSTIVGGVCNRVGGCGAFIGGGICNTSRGDTTSVAGGTCNSAFQSFATIAGGCRNFINNQYDFIGGGGINCINGSSLVGFNVIDGGCCNLIFGTSASSIVGGYCNTLSGGSIKPHTSFIAGGCCNFSQYCNTFTLGSNLTASQANYTYVNNISSTGVVAGCGNLLVCVARTIPTGIAGANAVCNIVALTQACYNIITPDNNTFYIITA